MDTVVRAFELPIQKIEPASGWELLRECWYQATCLANWSVDQLRAHDACLQPDQSCLPKYQIPDLYALAFGREVEKRGRNNPDKVLPVVVAQFAGGDFFAGAMQSATCIFKAVQTKYLSERTSVLYHRTQQFSCYRYPYPWPVHAAGWKAADHDESGHPYVRLSLPGGQVTIRLRTGQDFGRQLAMFRQIVSGDLPRKQLILRGKPVIGSSHRRTISDREGTNRVMVKMVASFPVHEVKTGRVLTLTTTPDSFWVAELDGRPAWVLNNDHFRRVHDWIAVHDARMQRLRQDAKSERRLNPRAEGQWQRSLDRCCMKHSRRMNSWLQESSAHLTGFAERNRVAEVIYDDSCRDFMPHFPWAQLKTLLKQKLEIAGIALHSAPNEQ